MPTLPRAPSSRRFNVAGRTSGTSPYRIDRKSTRLNSSHSQISYAVFCLKKKKNVLLGEMSSINRAQCLSLWTSDDVAHNHDIAIVSSTRRRQETRLPARSHSIDLHGHS